MKALTLIVGNSRSLFELAGEIRAAVRNRTVEFALVVRPSGQAVLLTASSRHAQVIAHDHPEQIAGVFSRIHDVATIRRDIQRWMDAGATHQTLAPIQLIDSRKSMWSGSMFRSTRRPAPRPNTPSRRPGGNHCPVHGTVLAIERDRRGRPMLGTCPRCDEQNREAIRQLQARL